jgi:hypothetical protein
MLWNSEFVRVCISDVEGNVADQWVACVQT